MNVLEAAEPAFYPHWRAGQNDDDPQLERWIEREAQQLETGRRWVEETTGPRSPEDGDGDVERGEAHEPEEQAVGDGGLLPVREP